MPLIAQALSKLGLMAGVAAMSAATGPSSSPSTQSPPVASPAESAIEYQLKVEDYSGGNCSFVSLVGASGEPIVDSCHGWSASNCVGSLLVLGNGVVADEAHLILGEAGRQARRVLDLAEALQHQIKRSRGERYGYLHLGFRSPRCDSEGLALPFEGSTIEDGIEGPAQAMDGAISIDRNGRIAIRFSRI